MAQDWGEVTIRDFPGDVHDDFLECYLLLNSAKHCFLLCTGEQLAPSAGMLSRNDLTKLMADSLDEPLRRAFLEYADALFTSFSMRRHPPLPMPIPADVFPVSQAENLARHLLENGDCPVWSAARQVALLLHRERPRHSCMATPETEGTHTFTFGAYSKGPFTGFCRRTLTHPNVARLFNFMIAHVCPSHRWAAVEVLFNCFLPLHLDRGNNSEPNLVTSLSLHEAGDIWIACNGGTDFQEHSGTLVPGRKFSVQLQSVVFAANKHLHGTCSWEDSDRVLLAAYTPGHWDTLHAPLIDKLRDLGFQLPPQKRSPPQNLHHDCLPSVLRE